MGAAAAEIGMAGHSSHHPAATCHAHLRVQSDRLLDCSALPLIRHFIPSHLHISNSSSNSNSGVMATLQQFLQRLAGSISQQNGESCTQPQHSC